jgi:ADP-ribose pyrophosphatase YjhB (NUDIX family)
MGYIGSYIWKIRQKVGDERLITATVDVLPIDNDGRIKFVYVSQFKYWAYIGGHVELGDSWRSAALNELKEEGGITAREEDLELFATVSGPGRIFQYANGSTQPFTLAFLCRNWQIEEAPTDSDEVEQTVWLTLSEAKAKKTNPHTTLVLGAYEEYLRTNKVQMIEEL